MDQIIIYTDGSCLENSSAGGPGGWAYIIVGKDEKYSIEQNKGYFKTTNNRMEMMACLEALLEFDYPKRIIIHTDSQYLIDGMTKWIYGWRKRNWVTGYGEAVKNKDLWQALIDASKFHKVTYVKVKAHNGDKYNERCDVLAKEAARNPELDDVGFVPTHNLPKIKYPYYFRKK